MDSDMVVGLDQAIFDSGYCGRSITITRTSSGATVTAIVADDCPGCSSADSVNLSVGAFTALGTEDEGIVGIFFDRQAASIRADLLIAQFPVTWEFND